MSLRMESRVVLTMFLPLMVMHTIGFRMMWHIIGMSSIPFHNFLGTLSPTAYNRLLLNLDMSLGMLNSRLELE